MSTAYLSLKLPQSQTWNLLLKDTSLVAVVTKTVAIYETALRSFLWFCRESGYPREPQIINATHIWELSWYLASEANRWGDNNPAIRKPASRTTVNGYYRALRTFFNWLEYEQLIGDNPFKFLKTPKPDMTSVQALTPTVTVLISKMILGNINAVSRSN